MLSKEAKQRMLEARLKHEAIILHSMDILNQMDEIKVPSTYELLKELTIPKKYDKLFISDSAIS